MTPAGSSNSPSTPLPSALTGRQLTILSTARRLRVGGRSSPTLPHRRYISDCFPAGTLPPALRRSLDRFVWDTPVLKVNYALDAPIPWRSKNLGDAGTVHLGADHDGLIRWMADLNTVTLQQNPLMLFGQVRTADPTRSPVGTESAWAYTHLPRGLADDHSAESLAQRVDRVLEERAPGFTKNIVGKTIQRPSDLEASDANLHTGAVNGGTSQLFQQLIFRPLPGFGSAETPLQNDFLGSAGASPGGGVHGVCDRNAARAALAAAGASGWPCRRVTGALSRFFTT